MDKKYLNNVASVTVKLFDESNQEEIKRILDYAISKSNLFSGNDFLNPPYKDDDTFQDLYISTICYVFKKFRENTPEILSGKKLELFKLLFNIDDLLIYLRDFYLETRTLLEKFDNLDRTRETMSLIADNYICMIINRSKYSDNVIKDLRLVKINKILKDE